MTVTFSSPTIKLVMRKSSSLNFVCHRSIRSPLSISSTRSFFSTTSGTPLFFLSTLTSVSVGNGNSPASISLTCTRHSPSSSNINRMMIDTIRLIPGVSTLNASTRLGLRVAMLLVRWLRLHTPGHKRPPQPTTGKCSAATSAERPNASHSHTGMADCDRRYPDPAAKRHRHRRAIPNGLDRLDQSWWRSWHARFKRRLRL